MKITFDRWPWQKRHSHWSFAKEKGDTWGWGIISGMGRFGGGWNFKLGIMAGGHTIIINLIFGSIRISFGEK